MNRQKRVGELIKKEISAILTKKVADPRIGFVSVTEVEMTADLRFAKIFVSIYGSEKDKKDSMRGLQSAKGYIQVELSRNLDLRYTPNISFVRDKSIERGSRVMAIMSRLEKEAAECERLSKKSSR
ncbi:30S ribosome-binding factor RbfA [Candidatus Margulisiibacteriota bacterium]